MRVIAPLRGYGVVAFLLKYMTTYCACRCLDGAIGSLRGCADDGPEQAVGKGVEPCVHVYHAGVDYTGVASIYMYAMWGEFLSQVSGE